MGTAVIHTFLGLLISILLVLGLDSLVQFSFMAESNLVTVLLIFLLGDYSGTLNPHISFNLNNDESLSFLGFMSILKNSVLLFILFNMMPETQSESESL
jgi:hypothetical protein